jgi:hypothetical protein
MTLGRKIRLVLGGVAVTLTLGLTACSGSEDTEQNDPTANANYERQKANTPIPNLSNSLERKNIAEHLNRNNDPNRIRYVYIYTKAGAPIGYYVAKGKITSAGAQLTPTDDIVDPCSGSYCPTVVQGPTDDGSFGGDEGGVYFFTDTGVEIQTNMDWVLLDQPMKIDVPRLLIG